MNKIILPAPSIFRCASLLATLLIGCLGFGQPGKPPSIVLKLAAANKPVLTTNLEIVDPTILFPIPEPFTRHRLQLIKSNGPLYALVEGTGQVYQLDTTAGSYKWKRIDSTYYAGYNFRSFNFWVDSTLYSYGGTGLWNTNGGLRYYVHEKFEWEIALVDKEIPHMFQPNDFYYVDTTNKALYLLGINSHNATLDNNNKLQEEIGNRAWKLDLRNRKWTELGKAKDTNVRVLGNSPWGLFYINTVAPGIADFAHNRYLEAGNSGKLKFSKFFRSREQTTIGFFIDSTFYFGNLSGYLDSIRFSSADFVDTGTPIYTKTRWNLRKFIQWIPWILLLISVGLTIYLYRKYRKLRDTGDDKDPEELTNKPLFDSIPHPPVFHSSGNHFKLDDKEKAVLQYILQQSQERKVVTIDELNKILGVSNKSPEIQKRQRSDTLIAINQKLTFLTGLRQPLIDKRRSDSDKRSFEYFIHPEHFERLKELG